MGFSPTIKKLNLFETLLTVLPEFSSIKDLISALLIPFNLPVTKNDLSFNNPLFFFSAKLSIFKTCSNSFKTLMLSAFLKKI